MLQLAPSARSTIATLLHQLVWIEKQATKLIRKQDHQTLLMPASIYKRSDTAPPNKIMAELQNPLHRYFKWLPNGIRRLPNTAELIGTKTLPCHPSLDSSMNMLPDPVRTNLNSSTITYPSKCNIHCITHLVLFLFWTLVNILKLLSVFLDLNQYFFWPSSMMYYVYYACVISILCCLMIHSLRKGIGCHLWPYSFFFFASKLPAQTSDHM